MKGQASMELVMIVGIALVLAAPFILEAQGTFIDLQIADQNAELQTSINDLSSSIRAVNSQDKYSKRTTEIALTDNIESVQVINNKALIFTQERAGEQRNFTRIFDNKIELEGVPEEEGLHELKVQSMGDRVLVQGDAEQETVIQKIFSIMDLQDWNRGVFEGTSVDRNDNSGNLGLGYLNGTNPSSKDLEEGLIGYWRMDRNIAGSGGNVIDYSGNQNNGTTDGGVNTGLQGILGSSSFEFDYSDQEYVDHPDLSNQFDDEATISLWLKRSNVNTPSDSDATGIFNYGYNQNNDRSHYPWTNGNLYFSTFADDRKVDGLDNTGFNKTKWHHLLITTSPGADNYKVYQNGSLIAERDGPESLTLPSNMRFGYSDSSYYFNGKMDEVRLYNRSLTEDEVRQLYFRGKPFKGNYTSETIENSEQQNWDALEINATIPSSTELTATFETLQDSLIFDTQQKYSEINDWNEGGFTRTTGDIVPLAFKSISEFKASNQSEFNQGDFKGTSADRKDNSGDLGIGYLNGTKSGKPNDIGLNNESLVGFWRLERSVSDEGTVLDYSGENRDGSLETGGNTVSVAQGIFSTNGYEFDGTNDYILTPQAQIEGDEILVSAWVKPEHSGSNYQRVVSAGTYQPWNLVIYEHSNSEWEPYMDLTTQNSRQPSNEPWNGKGPNTFEYGKWHLLIGKYNSSEVSLWVDGEKVYSESVSGNLDESHYNKAQYTTIGDRNDGNQNERFKGNMDEVLIFNRSLSKEEIEELYFQGVDGKFEGSYVAERIDNGEGTEWNSLEVDASVPSDTSVNATFKALNNNENAVDSQTLTLNEGLQNYSLSVSSSVAAEVVINGSSSNVTKSWEVHGLEVFSSEVVDKNEGLRIGYRNGSSDDDLVGYWRFDRNVSGEGGTVKDYSGNKNRGSIVNGADFAGPGIFSDRLLNLSGDAEYVGVPEKSLENFTISLFAKYNGLNSDGDESDMVISNGGASGDFIQTSTSTSNGFGLRLAIGGDSQRVTWSGLESAGIEENLTHIVLVKEGVNLRAYIDGDDRGAESLSDNYSFTFDTIGADWAGKDRSRYSFNGLIDEVRVYNRTLTKEEVEGLYFHGSPFSGIYNAGEVDNNRVTSWREVEVNASIPADTDLTGEFEALGAGDNVVDEETFSVEDGVMNYTLNVEQSQDARLSFNGSSSSVFDTWKIFDYEIYSGRREVEESESFDVTDGLNQFQLGVGNSRDSRISLEGNSSNITRTWHASNISVSVAE
jgi:hypothetical protein